jgi:perosamine synthetase
MFVTEGGGERHGVDGTLSHGLGVGPGDEVVIPAYTFMATAVAVHHVAATPVYADIDPKTLNLDPASFEAAISDKTKL